MYKKWFEMSVNECFSSLRWPFRSRTALLGFIEFVFCAKQFDEFFAYIFSITSHEGGGLPTCRTQCPGTWVLLDGPFGRLLPAKGIVSTEFDEEEEDSPLLARLLVWKEPDETEPGLVIGAAVASSAKKKWNCSSTICMYFGNGQILPAHGLKLEHMRTLMPKYF